MQDRNQNQNRWHRFLPTRVGTPNRQVRLILSVSGAALIAAVTAILLYAAIADAYGRYGVAVALSVTAVWLSQGVRAALRLHRPRPQPSGEVPMHPQCLHALATTRSLIAAREALATAVQREREERRAWQSSVAAASTLRAWRPSIVPIRGSGHGDPVGGAAVGVGDPSSGRLEQLASSVETRLRWVTRDVPLERVAGILPRMNSSGAAILAGWFGGIDREIREALGMGDGLEILPGTQCPACGMRPLRVYPGGPVICSTRCLCVGQGCGCGMPLRVTGVEHIWERSVRPT